jgi:hypothetical protein
MTITGGRENLGALGRLVLWHGAQAIRIDTAWPGGRIS